MEAKPANTDQPMHSSPMPDPSENKQSTGAMIIAIVVLVIVLIGGVGLFYFSYKSSQPKANPTPAVNQRLPQQPSVTTVQTGANQTPTNTTDQQLDQDAQKIDANLSLLDTDVNNVNQGLNDQQGDLSQ